VNAEPGRSEQQDLDAAPDVGARHQPFPLTDVQWANWVGRSTGAAGHWYFEWDCVGLDVARLEQAWRRLVARHDMLRAVVRPDGRQQVLAEVPEYDVRTLDLGDPGTDAPARLDELRAERSHRPFDAAAWPPFELHVSLLPDRMARVHLGLDVLVADAWSVEILMRDWERLYRDPEAAPPALEVTFRDCVLSETGTRWSDAEALSLRHWRERAADLPPAPELPLAASPATVGPRFERRSRRLDRETWAQLRGRAGERGMTPSGLLLAAYAEVLSAWSRRPELSISLTTFNRPPLHQQVEDVVGDFTSPVPVAVRPSGAGSFEERARRLQERVWEDLDHRDVSAARVLRELAGARPGEWPRLPAAFTSLLTARGEPLASLRWLGDLVHARSQSPRAWLEHQACEEEGALVLTWDAVEELFPRGLLDDMLETYAALLGRLAAGDEAWGVADLGLRPAWRRPEREEPPRRHAARVADTGHSLQLPMSGDGPGSRTAPAGRADRAFSWRPVPLDAFARLLRLLCEVELDGEPHSLYPSASGTYPVQVYLHVRPGRVDGVPSGLCYLHPLEGRLVWLSHGAEPDPEAHAPADRMVVEAAAFSMFLVGELAAVAPVSGDAALTHAAHEAGCMTQLLRAAAPDLGIGLCPAGSVDLHALRGPLGLGPSHVMLHALLGGAAE
jgi:SagB-type dehydrogenase family enzyme